MKLIIVTAKEKNNDWNFDYDIMPFDKITTKTIFSKSEALFCFFQNNSSRLPIVYHAGSLKHFAVKQKLSSGKFFDFYFISSDNPNLEKIEQKLRKSLKKHLTK